MNVRAAPHLPYRTRPAPDAPARRRLRRGAIAAAAALVILLSLAAPAFGAATSITMVGRGWGHGIGMSQWGAYGYAKHDWTFDQILKHYYTGIKLGKVPNDPIRVRLRGGVATVRVTSTKAYLATVGSTVIEVPGGTTTTVSWDGGKYRVTAGTLSKRFSVPVLFKPKSAMLRSLTADDWGKTGRYRGQLRVLHTTSGFTLINKVSLENYLRGVVPYEMSATWPLEALKAQACAARSYAQRSRDPGQAFDVYCTTRDQVYRAVPEDASIHARSDQAVKETAGVVPTYDGAPISAFYFSSSGGHTENIENVWQTSAVPYLKGVEDPYDTYATYHLWPENPRVNATSWYVDKLGKYSDTNPTGVKGTLTTIYVLKRGVSPRVVKAAVVGSNGVTIVSGASLRYKLALRDTWVSFRSMSLAATDASVVYGGKTTVKGRTYPGLADGAEVTLHVYKDGAWTTRSVATTRHTQSLGSGYTATYSSYSVDLTPKQATTYYVTRGDARSPRVKVTVAPAVTATVGDATVAPGDTLSVGGSVLPLLAGAKVLLQTRTGTAAWTDALSGTLTSEGAFSFDWKAVAGVTALRVRVPVTAGLAAGNSPAIAVTVS